MNAQVILVNTKDEPVGLMDKMEAHKKGLLHRAFSIFIFNHRGQLMMQQRAFDKYHSGGLWTNTCCSHPIENESTQDTAHKRLIEEMGISCDLKPISKFIYKAELEHNLIEHEYDHLFIGYSDDEPIINKSEANAWKWMDIDTLKEDVNINPEIYTAWLKPAFEHLVDALVIKEIRMFD
ncbi:MAG: isopentenyl-diphosphate Delta-isomerase [Bacteroidetes bacterium]|nr:isopentenyl-diphosphate Delta-isomerase [Bacteroidota bacterium]